MVDRGLDSSGFARVPDVRASPHESTRIPALAEFDFRTQRKRLEFDTYFNGRCPHIFLFFTTYKANLAVHVHMTAGYIMAGELEVLVICGMGTTEDGLVA